MDERDEGDEIMAFCHQCGSEMAPDERFCGECGATAAETPTTAPPGEATSPSTQMPPPTGPPLSSGSPGQGEVVPVADGSDSATPTSRRTALMVGAVAAVAALVVGVVMLTGGDEQSAPLGTGADSTDAPNGTGADSTDAPATTDAPTTDAPTTTDAPSTTAAPTTDPPSTTAAPTTTPATTVPTVAAGWRPAQMIPQAQIPPFDTSWTGIPSPVITDRSGPIPDGVYWVNYVSQNSTTLSMDLGRFESCLLLDEFICGPGPYTDSDIGPLYPAEGTVNVSLDATTRIVIEGWDCAPVVAEGNGADLAAMYAALTADFDLAFASGLNSGVDPFELMIAVREDPATPFGPPPASCDDGYSLVWRFGDAPPVLVQQIFDYETGGPIDPPALIAPTAIELIGDQATVYFYASFLS